MDWPGRMMWFWNGVEARRHDVGGVIGARGPRVVYGPKAPHRRLRVRRPRLRVCGPLGHRVSSFVAATLLLTMLHCPTCDKRLAVSSFEQTTRVESPLATRESAMGHTLVTQRAARGAPTVITLVLGPGPFSVRTLARAATVCMGAPLQRGVRRKVRRHEEARCARPRVLGAWAPKRQTSTLSRAGVQGKTGKICVGGERTRRKSVAQGQLRRSRGKHSCPGPPEQRPGSCCHDLRPAITRGGWSCHP
mmetsp:Transcript_42257/g.78251  ORF Transcript_42257/g.78251 Transcript_42257/m.78251 type:complete len:248 (-) Transcript_42257:3769-4512(-)